LCDAEHSGTATQWREFVMDLESLNPDIVETVFLRHGVQSVTFTDAGDKPVLEPGPGETPLWSETRISGLFAADANLESLAEELLQACGIDVLPQHSVITVEDRAWDREWIKDISPLCFGSRLWICPGDTTVDDEDAVIVRLDPGLAFGTGTHATTALCLKWLDSLPLENTTMLDYGCGSGVLAIAALMLGARNACAMDIDPQAVTATRDNANRNGVAERLTVAGNAQDIQGEFDVVVANILAGPLIELAGSVAGHVKIGGSLALSGILHEQINDVLNAYAPWIQFDAPASCEQSGQTWARLTGRRIGD
jgi:ribosomal protein L11 methyltransferase